MILSNDQSCAVQSVVKWFLSPSSKIKFELVGPAGSGKSTIVSFIKQSLNLTDNQVVFVTYTGKAALVLQRKGNNNCCTIHRLIYDLIDEQEDVKDNKGNPVVINGVVKKKIKRKFIKKAFLDSSIKLIVADECSMINENVLKDLLSFGIKVLFLGDKNQLPPIEGKSPLFENPDYILSEVLRQSRDNPILYIADLILKNKKIPIGRYGKYVLVISRRDITDELLLKTDITLCCTNKNRTNFNNKIRHLRGFDEELPQKGDKIICRKNNWGIECEGYPLINGMIGWVNDFVSAESLIPYQNSFSINFRPEFLEDSYEDLRIDTRPFLNGDFKLIDIKTEKFNTNNIFEYGNAVTVHLSQGSSWKKVLFYSDLFGDKDLRKKLAYTAVTRAEKFLIIAL